MTQWASILSQANYKTLDSKNILFMGSKTNAGDAPIPIFQMSSEVFSYGFEDQLDDENEGVLD
jgi:hypothetical protein